MYSAIVLAAGKGRRFNSDIPKQYLPLLGKPMISYSLKAFEDSMVDEIILVINEGDQDMVQGEIVEKYGFTKVKSIVSGGAERFYSVYAGLSKATKKYVLIHDGARALITAEQINSMCEAVERYEACVAAMPSKDTVKLADNDSFVISTPDRNSVWIIQTPQAFDRVLVTSAYKKMMACGDVTATDDAMVVEKYENKKIRLIPLSYENIKLTTPEDMIFAQEIIKKRSYEDT